MCEFLLRIWYSFNNLITCERKPSYSTSPLLLIPIPKAICQIGPGIQGFRKFKFEVIGSLTDIIHTQESVLYPDDDLIVK